MLGFKVETFPFQKHMRLTIRGLCTIYGFELATVELKTMEKQRVPIATAGG
jgi:hypothetical protein